MTDESGSRFYSGSPEERVDAWLVLADVVAHKRMRELLILVLKHYGAEQAKLARGAIVHFIQ